MVPVKRTYFTIEQARLMLPEVQKHLRKVNRMRRHLFLLDSMDISHEDPEQDDRIQRAMEKEFHRASYQVYDELDKIDKKGVMLRDLDEGLIDFRSTFQGREIFLCWRIGEPTVNFWHEADDGFQGRKSIHALRKDKFHAKEIRENKRDKRKPRRISVQRK